MNLSTRLVCCVATLGGALSLGAQSGAISPVAARTAILARIDAAVGVAELPPVKFAGLKDPFHPPAADLREPAPAAKDPAATTFRSETDLVVLLAAKLQPTGSVVLGGEPYLLFGEKRQKKGDKLTLSHEGVEYVVEIVNIENNQFRIRYRNEETTRPVK